ncbi:hypothetical protein HDV00_006092 [Rhizophlyctis rosea]|nr:hypothetical protein HDV00_006092 [Rhizophlyctis rosea]
MPPKRKSIGQAQNRQPEEDIAREIADATANAAAEPDKVTFTTPVVANQLKRAKLDVSEENAPPPSSYQPDLAAAALVASTPRSEKSNLNPLSSTTASIPTGNDASTTTSRESQSKDLQKIGYGGIMMNELSRMRPPSFTFGAAAPAASPSSSFGTSTSASSTPFGFAPKPFGFGFAPVPSLSSMGPARFAGGFGAELDSSALPLQTSKTEIRTKSDYERLEHVAFDQLGPDDAPKRAHMTLPYGTYVFDTRKDQSIAQLSHQLYVIALNGKEVDLSRIDEKKPTEFNNSISLLRLASGECHDATYRVGSIGFASFGDPPVLTLNQPKHSHLITYIPVTGIFNPAALGENYDLLPVGLRSGATKEEERRPIHVGRVWEEESGWVLCVVCESFMDGAWKIPIAGMMVGDNYMKGGWTTTYEVLVMKRPDPPPCKVESGTPPPKEKCKQRARAVFGYEGDSQSDPPTMSFKKNEVLMVEDSYADWIWCSRKKMGQPLEVGLVPSEDGGEDDGKDGGREGDVENEEDDDGEDDEDDDQDNGEGYDQEFEGVVTGNDTGVS